MTWAQDTNHSVSVRFSPGMGVTSSGTVDRHAPRGAERGPSAWKGTGVANGRELSGVLPVIQTPFDAGGRIDETSLTAELEWVLDQGVSGLTTGMVSEVLTLQDAERRRLTEVVVDVARDRGALSVISCGAESVEQAVAYARHAEQRGADAVMAIAPVSVDLDDEATFRYFVEIVDSTVLGVVVQDASGYVGRSLSIEVQSRLHDKYGRRVYFKPEAPPIGQRLTMLRDATDGEARAFEGTGGAALVDSFRRGVVGTMPGAEVCWAIQRMWVALQAGEWSLAYDINGLLSLLINLQTSIDSFVAIEKHILVRQGVIGSARARPTSDYVLDDETREEVDRLVDRLRALVPTGT
jgi:dihydrodipicolinate synthase/N-acetylneuraminate lyase